MAPMFRSEVVFSFHCVDHEDQAYIVKLSNKCLHLLNLCFYWSGESLEIHA